MTLDQVGNLAKQFEQAAKERNKESRQDDLEDNVVRETSCLPVSLGR